MAIAFMGYVLPFGQMSFWGATVITNLLSPFPSLVEWVCGGYCVHSPTLKRFFLFHFLSLGPLQSRNIVRPEPGLLGEGDVLGVGVEGHRSLLCPDCWEAVGTLPM